MKLFLLLSAIFAISHSESLNQKSWLTFQNEVGYKFKYPSCWKVQIDSPNQDVPLNKSRNIVVNDTAKCPAPKLSEIERGVGIFGGYGPKNKIQDALKEIQLRQRNSRGQINQKRIMAFKTLKLGDATAIAWVEVYPATQDLRWEFKIYCPDWWLQGGGPTIDHKNIDKSFYDKFKKDDLAWPEPEKSIFESIRCIPAKQKADPQG